MHDETPRFGLRDVLCLLLVVACAAGTRVAFLVVAADSGYRESPLTVQGHAPLPEGSGTDDLVRNVRDHGWFGGRAPLSDQEEPTAHLAPGYSWLFGLIARYHEAPDAVLRWLQCGLGVLTVLCFFLFMRRAFHSTLVATLTGLLGACYPFWVVNTAELADGTLASFLLAAALMLGTRGSQVGGAFTSLLFGLSLAALAMVRAALLPFTLMAILWFLWRSRAFRWGWFAGLLAFLGYANGLAPWAVRNWQTFGEPLPIVDSAYLHLWMGNNPSATGAALDEKGLRASLPPDRLTDLLAEPNQAHRYAQLAPLVRDEVAADPAAALGRRINAVLTFVLGASWFHDGRLGEVRAGEGVTEAPEWMTDNFEPSLRASLILLLALALLGWRWSAARAHASRLAALAVVWVPLPYILSHAGFLSGPRLPLDGALLCYAAFALARLVPGFARQQGELPTEPAEA
jgi:hypothetical protein